MNNKNTNPALRMFIGIITNEEIQLTYRLDTDLLDATKTKTIRNRREYKAAIAEIITEIHARTVAEEFDLTTLFSSTIDFPEDSSDNPTIIALAKYLRDGEEDEGGLHKALTPTEKDDATAAGTIAAIIDDKEQFQILRAGMRVRSYDFGLSRPTCFVEGVLMGITEEKIEGCRRYQITTTRRVFDGKDVEISQAEALVLPPVNGTQVAFGFGDEVITRGVIAI